jgi:hypothetical protein
MHKSITRINPNNGGDEAVYELFGKTVPKADKEEKMEVVKPVEDKWLSIFNDALFDRVL